MSGVVYLIEVYLAHSNSALAVNNLVRSAFAASFPLFTIELLIKSGIRVGGSILGGICVALIPFPLIFWALGHRIRDWSKFAVYESKWSKIALSRSLARNKTYGGFRICAIHWCNVLGEIWAKHQIFGNWEQVNKIGPCTGPIVLLVTKSVRAIDTRFNHQ